MLLDRFLEIFIPISRNIPLIKFNVKNVQDRRYRIGQN